MYFSCSNNNIKINVDLCFVDSSRSYVTLCSLVLQTVVGRDTSRAKLINHQTSPWPPRKMNRLITKTDPWM